MIVPENLEPPQLLHIFTDKMSHSPYHSSSKYPTHILPTVFMCEVNRGVVTFAQLQRPVVKKSLKSNMCYLLSYKALVSNVELIEFEVLNSVASAESSMYSYVVVHLYSNHCLLSCSCS